jgi:hypothetical protein
MKVAVRGARRWLDGTSAAVDFRRNIATVFAYFPRHIFTSMHGPWNSIDSTASF